MSTPEAMSRAAAEFPEVLTKKQAASFLQCSPQSLDYLILTDQIPYSRIGQRSIRFLKSSLIDYLRKRQNQNYRLGPRARKERPKLAPV